MSDFPLFTSERCMKRSINESMDGLKAGGFTSRELQQKFRTIRRTMCGLDFELQPYC